LLDFAEDAHGRLPERRAYALPGTSLSIGFAAPEYVADCDRAYLPSSCHHGDDRQVALAVLDYETLPHLARWTGRWPDFHDITTGLAEHGLRGAYDPDYQMWDVYDPRRGLGVRVMQEASRRPPWERSFPLRLLLHWAGQASGSGILHAGTLGHKGLGVLVVGVSGSGKSGTTLSGILNGLSSVGDDYIAISTTTGGCILAQPVMRTMKQDIAGLQRLGLEPGKAALDEPLNWQGKMEFDFDALAPGARVERLAMAGLLMPHIARSPRSTFRPASPREAMMAMAPSSLRQLYGSWREDFGALAAITRALPGFHLDLSEDPAEIAAAVRSFIEKRAQ
jgi:hypothetical protein